MVDTSCTRRIRISSAISLINNGIAGNPVVERRVIHLSNVLSSVFERSYSVSWVSARVFRPAILQPRVVLDTSKFAAVSRIYLYSLLSIAIIAS